MSLQTSRPQARSRFICRANRYLDAENEGYDTEGERRGERKRLFNQRTRHELHATLLAFTYMCLYEFKPIPN